MYKSNKKHRHDYLFVKMYNRKAKEKLNYRMEFIVVVVIFFKYSLIKKNKSFLHLWNAIHILEKCQDNKNYEFIQEFGETTATTTTSTNEKNLTRHVKIKINKIALSLLKIGR